jgi:predicted transcriptional regulator
MDKVLSARVDQTVAAQIGSLARRLRTSKKRVIENAVRSYAQELDREQRFDALEASCGAWQRKEPVCRTVERARSAFRRAMERHRP